MGTLLTDQQQEQERVITVRTEHRCSMFFGTETMMYFSAAGAGAVSWDQEQQLQLQRKSERVGGRWCMVQAAAAADWVSFGVTFSGNDPVVKNQSLALFGCRKSE
jgi:hypothetical protein